MGVIKQQQRPLNKEWDPDCPVSEEMRRVFGSDADRIWPSTPEARVKAVAQNMAAAAGADEEVKKELDMVHLPQHYARFKIEPIRFIVENLGPTFLVGNIIKYVMRYPHKNKIEDCRKAMRYAEMLVKFESGDPDWWK